jgi:hypothetical protein
MIALYRLAQLLTLLMVVFLLSACGGGGSSDQSMTPEPVVPGTHTVSTAAGTGGSIDPTSGTVNHGAIATFTVTPEPGHSIDAVVGCGGSLDGSTYTTGIITRACTVDATFSLNQYTLIYTAGPNGSLSGETVQAVSRAESGTAVTAVPDTGYSFTQWGDSSTANPRTDSNVTGDLSVEASFLLNAYTVSTTASLGGSSGPTSQMISHGDTAVFTLEREQGFGISRVTGCGGTRLGDTYTTGPIVESCVVEAVFGELVSFGTNPINDTGIDWCADAANNYDLGDAAYKTMQCEAVTNAGFPGQDGHHGRDALARAGELPKIGDGVAGFDFTKIANNGAKLPASATLGSGPDDWACTRDNVTGLIWDVKVDNNDHLRHWSHTYTWYDPSSPDGTPGTANGGICTGSACDTSSFIQAVNDEGLCGANDWRMPTGGELSSLAHMGKINPAIDTTFFPYSHASDPSSVFDSPDLTRVWSASPAAPDSNSAWLVTFYTGGQGYMDKGGKNRVWSVRGRE